MPCDQIRLTRVELGAQTNRKLLIEALTAMGATVEERSRVIFFNLNGYTGSVKADNTLVCQEEHVNPIKVAYARKVLAQATVKFGWTAKQDLKDKNKYVVTKRR
jgi:hypothetical protein